MTYESPRLLHNGFGIDFVFDSGKLPQHEWIALVTLCMQTSKTPEGLFVVAFDDQPSIYARLSVIAASRTEHEKYVPRRFG